jgi:hypothetical protein
MPASTTGSLDAPSSRPPSQHSRYGDQFEAILLEELSKHMLDAAGHPMLGRRVLQDKAVLERARRALQQVHGYNDLLEACTATWKQNMRSRRSDAAAKGPRALRFEELEADLWGVIPADAAAPLLDGVRTNLFAACALMPACGQRRRPHGAGVMIVEATTDGRTFMMELKLVKLERVLAYAYAELQTVVCAMLAVQQPEDPEPERRLLAFLEAQQRTLPRVWSLARSGCLCLATVPGELALPGIDVLVVGGDSDHFTEPCVAVHGADYMFQMHSEMNSVVESVERLELTVQESEQDRQRLERERAADIERLEREHAAHLWRLEQERAVDRALIQQLMQQVQELGRSVANSNDDISQIKQMLQPPQSNE